MMNLNELRERFDYHPDGYLINRHNQPGGGRMKSGERAGTYDGRGYRVISIKGKRYKEHRLVYLWHYGIIEHQIDHINNIPDDNRIENLRDVPQSVNQMNRIDTKRNGGQLHPSSIRRKKYKERYRQS